MKKRYRIFLAFGLAWIYEVEVNTPKNKKLCDFFHLAGLYDLETFKKVKAW